MQQDQRKKVGVFSLNFAFKFASYMNYCYVLLVLHFNLYRKNKHLEGDSLLIKEDNMRFRVLKTRMIFL